MPSTACKRLAGTSGIKKVVWISVPSGEVLHRSIENRAMQQTTDADSGTFLIGEHQLPAIVAIPDDPAGVVIFAHGTDSCRRSPRNQTLAERLQTIRIATVLFDFFRDGEKLDPTCPFDCDILTKRLAETVAWVKSRDVLSWQPEDEASARIALDGFDRATMCFNNSAADGQPQAGAGFLGRVERIKRVQS